jgi:hypothetical protein
MKRQDSSGRTTAARGRGRWLAAWLTGLMAAALMNVAFAATMCAKMTTTSFKLDGVVAPGAPSLACSPDPLWGHVVPAQLASAGSPVGTLYVAYYDPTPADATNHDAELQIGISISGDNDVSDQDVVVLMFDRDHSGTWNENDFMIRVPLVPVTNPPTIHTTGEVCNQAVGAPEYYRRTAAGTWELSASASAKISTSARHARDLDIASDSEKRIWNFEIRLPVDPDATTDFDLNVTKPNYFRMGAFVYADDGHQQSGQMGTVLKWPDTLPDPSIGNNTPNGLQVLDPALAGKLADIKLLDVCYDVRFTNTSSDLMINGVQHVQGARSLNKTGENRFRFTYFFSGPAGATGNLSNPGDVELELVPYTGGSPSGVSWKKTQHVDVTPYAVNQARTLDTDLVFNWADAPPGFTSPNQTDFVCSFGTLKNFTLDDDSSNNNFHLNLNYFITSSHEQTLRFDGSSVPGAKPGKTSAVFFQIETTNDGGRARSASSGTGYGTGVAGSGGVGNGTMSAQLASAIGPQAALLFVLGLFIAAVTYGLRWFSRGRSVAYRSAALTVGTVVLAVLVVVACTKSRPTDDWSIPNAKELGIEPLPGKRGWYQMPIAYEEKKSLTLRIEGRPLPYETHHQRLTPAADGVPNRIDIPVKYGEAVAVIAFGGTDPDGNGPRTANSAAGFTEAASACAIDQPRSPDLRRRETAAKRFPSAKLTGRAGCYPLTAGYFRPNEYAGALIGSFDGFRTSFVVGTDAAIVAPQNATTLSLAVNARWEAYSLMTGFYDVNWMIQPAPKVPTHTAFPGDATYNVPPRLNLWDLLTSVNMYTYTATDIVSDGKLVSRTMQPWGDAHMTIYATHVNDRLVITEHD